MGSLALAVAQVAASPLDPETNLELTQAAVRAAAESGAELVVLPELVASGYVMDGEALHRIAESPTRPGPVLQGWSRVARECELTLVGGFPEHDGGRLYNSAVVFGPDGTVRSLYRKLHPYGQEQQIFTPGNLGLPVVEVGGVRIGTLVCYDLRFPEAMRILALQGAQVIAVPTAWVAGFDAGLPAGERIGQVDGALVQANLNCVFVACADLVGSSDPFSFLGRSVIADPFGQPLVGPISADEPGLVLARIDLNATAEAQKRGPGIAPIADRRTDVYGDLLGYKAPPPTAIEGGVAGEVVGGGE